MGSEVIIKHSHLPMRGRKAFYYKDWFYDLALGNPPAPRLRRLFGARTALIHLYFSKELTPF